MARFRADEADNYGGQGGAGFFSLKNDKDVARVRIMYNGVDDIEGYAVHSVEVNGKKRYVNCLREYNQPLDVCPFCAAKIPQAAKMFIPIYNEDEQKVQIWERGKTFFGKMSSVCARYASKGALVSQVFEVERNGKAHDTRTTYEFYPIENDGKTLADLPEVADPIGSVILDKTADDMNCYLDTGAFPPEDGGSDMPMRRRSANQQEDEPPFDEGTRRSAGTSRRTPATSRGGRDSF